MVREETISHVQALCFAVEGAMTGAGQIFQQGALCYQVLYYIDPDSQVAAGAVVARFRDPYSGGQIEIGRVESFSGFGFYFDLVLDMGGRSIKFDRTDGAFAVIQQVPCPPPSPPTPPPPSG